MKRTKKVQGVEGEEEERNFIDLGVLEIEKDLPPVPREASGLSLTGQEVLALGAVIGYHADFYKTQKMDVMHIRIEVMEKNLADLCHKLGGGDLRIRDAESEMKEQEALSLVLAKAERDVALAKAEIHKADKSGNTSDKADASRVMKAAIKGMESARKAIRVHNGLSN